MLATISKKQEIARGTLQVDFQLEEPVDFQPGQYMDLVWTDVLPYPDDRGGKRHFSIISSPNQKDILSMATRLRDSGFKRYLNELPIGSKVEIHHLGGKFVLPEDTSKNYCFIAGGIGITPFMSMLRYIEDNHLDYKITLIYSNRDQESTAFLEELENLKLEIRNFKLILTMTQDPSWIGEKARVDANFIKEYLSEPNNYIYYLAGPPQMVEGVTNELKLAGVQDQNIITENFTGY